MRRQSTAIIGIRFWRLAGRSALTASRRRPGSMPAVPLTTRRRPRRRQRAAA